jgi:hypothetical protein
VDADGLADIVAFTRGASPRVYVGPSTGFSFDGPRLASSYFCVDGEECRVADVDGDSHADIVAFTHNANPQVWVAHASRTGVEFTSPVLWSSYFCTSSETCLVGDVTGDGAADIVAATRGPENDVFVARSTP